MDLRLPDERDIVELRKRLVDALAGTPEAIPRGIFKPSALQSAVHRCRFGPFPPGAKADLWIRTALLVRGLVFEHAFADGNKRTGLLVAYSVLHNNGWRLIVSQGRATATMKRVAAGSLDVASIAQWLQANAKRYSTGATN